MTMRFNIQADYDSLQQFITGVSEQAVWKAATKAGNDSLRRSRTEAGRRIRAERKLKARRVREGIRLTPAKNRARWEMAFSGFPIGLIHYGARDTKRGVSVNITGRRQIVKGAFIATTRSGHTGVFMRRGHRRLPIDELFSTRVSDVALNTGFIESASGFFQERFTENWQRLVPVEIDRARARARRGKRRR